MRKKRFYDTVRLFWDKVYKTDHCWFWIGSVDDKGYGNFSEDGKYWSSHRYSYRLHFGEFDTQLKVCHTCDTTGCVRPDHLFLGTHTDNMHDAKAKGRLHGIYREKTNCPQGHEYNAENTYYKKNYPSKYCKKCMHERGALRRKKIMEDPIKRAALREKKRAYFLANKEKRSAYAKERYQKLKKLKEST